MPPPAVTVAVPLAALLHKGSVLVTDAVTGVGCVSVTVVVVENLEHR